MASLKLRVPPVAVVLIAAGLAWLLDRAAPPLRLAFPGSVAIASALAIAGALVAAAGVVQFRRARTTVNPMTPDAATSLVADGVYRRTRNPMYLGFLIALAGWVVYLANMASALVLPLFVLYMNRFQIAPEEHALAARFGRQFEDYRRAVRRWL